MNRKPEPSDDDRLMSQYALRMDDLYPQHPMVTTVHQVQGIFLRTSVGDRSYRVRVDEQGRIEERICILEDVVGFTHQLPEEIDHLFTEALMELLL